MTPDGDRPPTGGFGAREPGPVGWPDLGSRAGGLPPRPGDPVPRPHEPASYAQQAPVTRPISVTSPAARKGGRRARLTLKRIDPWSTLKFSFVYSLAGLIVLLVAVIALYAIVDAMGVIESISTFLHDVEGKSSGGVIEWLSFGRVLSVTLVIGLINVILFTAFATLTAFIYNVCTDLVGGVEVTLAERN